VKLQDSTLESWLAENLHPGHCPHYQIQSSQNPERAVQHFKIAATAGEYNSMHELLRTFNEGFVKRVAIDAILIAYNNACAEMRSEENAIDTLEMHEI